MNKEPATTPASRALSYESPQPRKGVGLRIFTWALVVGLVVFLVAKGPQYWNEIGNRFAYWRSSAVNMPADQIVYDDDPGDIAGLLGKKGYARVAPSISYVSPVTGATVVAGSPAVIFTPAELHGLDTYKHAGAVYCHERTTAGGVRGLVIITAAISASVLDHSGIATHAVTIAGGSATSWETRGRIEFPFSANLEVMLTPNDRFRIFAGQPDPNDASHFTLQYQINGQSGTIDGWVTDSHGEFKYEESNLKLKFRDGPATQRSTGAGNSEI